jgi:hypothetical protein
MASQQKADGSAKAKATKTKAPKTGKSDCLWPLETKLCYGTDDVFFDVCPTEEAGEWSTIGAWSEDIFSGPIKMINFVSPTEFIGQLGKALGNYPLQLLDSGEVSVNSAIFSATNCP